MEIVRFAGLIYRSTKIPASHVALLSSIQVNDRADVALLGASGFSLMSSPAPRSGLSRSDLVLWPIASVSQFRLCPQRAKADTGHQSRNLSDPRFQDRSAVPSIFDPSLSGFPIVRALPI